MDQNRHVPPSCTASRSTRKICSPPTRGPGPPRWLGRSCPDGRSWHPTERARLTRGYLQGRSIDLELGLTEGSVTWPQSDHLASGQHVTDSKTRLVMTSRQTNAPPPFPQRAGSAECDCRPYRSRSAVSIPVEAATRAMTSRSTPSRAEKRDPADPARS